MAYDKTTMNVTIDVELKERIRVRAKKENRKLSNMVTCLIEEGLK